VVTTDGVTPTMYHDNLEYATQCKQLEQYLAGDIALHPYALVAIVKRISIAFCMPSHEWSNVPAEARIRLPMVLVKLLGLPSSQKQPSLKHAIGVALVAFALSTSDYPGWVLADHTLCSRASEALAYHYPIKNSTQPVTAETRVRFASSPQSLLGSRAAETTSLLRFGLMGLLVQPCVQLLADSDLASFIETYKRIDWNLTYDSKRIHSINDNFNYRRHVNRAISSCLGLHPPSTSFASSIHARLECLETVDIWSILADHYDDDLTCLDLLKLLCQTAGAEDQVLCSNLLLRKRDGPTTVSREIFDRLQNEHILEILFTASNSKNARVAPLAMHYLWRFVDIILSGLHSIGLRNNVVYSQDEVRSMLRPLLKNDQTTLPTTVAGMELCERWISDLESIGVTAPRSILDSRIIEHMVGLFDNDWLFVRWITTSELPSPQDAGTEMNIRIWNLYKACEKSVATHNSGVDPPGSQS
jgi:hypothetical protein